MQRSHCVLLAILLLGVAPSAASAQTETALRRTEVVNDLLELRAARGESYFDLVMQTVGDSGPAVAQFITAPTPEGAPSLQVLERIATAVRDPSIHHFGGGPSPFADFLLSSGRATAVGAPALPATALVLRASAQFLAGRVKDELAIEYVDLLLELVERPIVDGLTTYSRQALGLVRETNYRAVLPLLRENVIRDFRAMPVRLTSETTFADAARQPDRRILSAAAVSVDIANGILASRPVLDVLGDLEALRPLTADVTIAPGAGILADDHARHVLIVVGAMAREYKQHQEDADTILRADARSPLFFAAFLASDLLKDRDRFPGIANPAAVSQSVFDGARELRRGIDRFRGLQELVESARESAQAADVIGNYLRVVSYVSDLALTHERLVPAADTSHLPAIVAATSAFSEAYAAWLSTNYMGMLAEVMSLADVLEIELLSRDARRYLVFAATFANASTADEMVAVIESAAMPPGGYRVKRESVALGLTAYGGGAAYSERLDSGEEALAGGLAFPVGAELSFPWRPSLGRLHWNTSVSLFLSAIDVGNLVSIRESDGAPDPTLEQVLAPGLGIQFGFGARNPWSFGVLAQSVRNLRETEEGADEDVFRIGVFLGIDMPLLRLWSR